MAIILNIDTAIETASVCIAKDAVPGTVRISRNRQDQASWLHPEIKDLLNETGVELQQLEAVAVTIGPGSYTGLRVGLSAAKGLCFALEIPLITINTLLVMADTVKQDGFDMICPLIDARRMEVFTALYDSKLTELSPAEAMIIDGNSFRKWLNLGKVLFLGNGVEKLKKVLIDPNAVYSESLYSAADMCQLSEDFFNNKEWADINYASPFYLKDFYTPAN